MSRDGVVQIFPDANGKFIDNAVFNRDGNDIYRQRVETRDYLGEVARGAVPGANIVRVVGRNPDVDDVREDLWEEGVNYVFPPAGGIQMQVVSTSASDAAAGVGAQTMHIHYLDASGNERLETITMNGLTPVLTVATDIWRVNEFHTLTAGSTGYVAGTIRLQSVGAATTYGRIEALGNRSRQAIYTVPLGKVAFINEAYIGGNADGGATSNFAEGYLRATCNITGDELLSGMFNFKWGAITANDTITAVFNPPIKCPALCDVKISMQSRAGTSNVRAVGGFSGWVEPA